jgi:hypothetical protein
MYSHAIMPNLDCSMSAAFHIRIVYIPYTPIHRALARVSVKGSGQVLPWSRRRGVVGERFLLLSYTFIVYTCILVYLIFVFVRVARPTLTCLLAEHVPCTQSNDLVCGPGGGRGPSRPTDLRPTSRLASLLTVQLLCCLVCCKVQGNIYIYSCVCV